MPRKKKPQAELNRTPLVPENEFETGFKQVVDVVAEARRDATLIYSGGVTSIGDLIALRPYGLEGAIVGTALYDGRIDLAEAQQALAEPRGA